jgi:hypothetical protein
MPSNLGISDSVANLEPDPEGSETFGRIRSGTEINVSDPDSDPDSNSGFESRFESRSKTGYKKICKKEPYFLAEIRWFHDYTYFTFTSSCNNRCKVEKTYK